MELLNKLTLKSLRLNIKRTVVTIIGIMLATALISAVASMFFSTKASLVGYEIEQGGNYHYSFTDVPSENILDFKLNQKVECVYITKDLGYAKIDGIINEYKPYVFVRGFTEDALENLGLVLTEGRLPKNENEILVPSHLKSNGGVTIEVGSTINLEVGTRLSEGYELNQLNPFNPEVKEEIADTVTKEYKVVGIMQRLSMEQEPYSAPGYTFATYLPQDDVEGNVGLYVRYTDKGLKDHEELTFQLGGNEKYSCVYNNSLVEMETLTFQNGTLMSLLSVCVCVAVIIVLTSVFCIKNSFDISITEKIRQYGMLSSIGATAKQIKQNVYYEAFLLGIVGIPLGILFGNLASFVLMHISGRLLSSITEMKLIYAFSWWAVLAAVLLGFVTVFLSARKSAAKAAKISPITAIRNSGNIQIQHKKLSTPKWARRIFGIGGEIAYKNLQRSKKKYRTTVVSIVVCASVFIAMNSFVSMAFDMVEAEFGSYDYDLEVYYEKNEATEGKIQEIRELDDVEESSIVCNGRIYVKTDNFTKEYLDIYPNAGKEADEAEEIVGIVILDDAAYRAYVKELGLDYDTVKSQGILLNQVIAYVYDETKQADVTMYLDRYTYQAGDTITGKAFLEEDDTNATQVSMEIAMVTDNCPLGVSDVTSKARLVVHEDYEYLCTYNMRWLYLVAEDADDVQMKIRDILDEEIFRIDNITEDVQTLEAVYTLMAIFLYGFITVIALIGTTNIFNTITTNMSLRQREFAMLKSVGMTKPEFNRMILLESFFYGAKSLLIGIPIGCVLSYMMYSVMMDGVLVLPYKLPIEAIVTSIVAVFALIIVIMKYSINKINKQNIIETIRNENI